MKWTVLSNMTGDNIYNKFVTNYEAESESTPLMVSNYGHRKIKDEWDLINRYWVYNGFRITYEHEKYQNNTEKDIWTVREVPISGRNDSYRDKIFGSLEQCVEFIDKHFRFVYEEKEEGKDAYV